MCTTGRTAWPTTTVDSNLRSAFDVIDVDRDGKISAEDLKIFYAGFATGDDFYDNIRAMISVADSNKDGFVEYDEFETVLRGCSGEINGSYGGGLLEDVFKVMDKDGDGRLNYEDLQSYMERAGMNASDDEIKAMIGLAGGDEKNAVSFDGLRKVFGC